MVHHYDLMIKTWRHSCSTAFGFTCATISLLCFRNELHQAQPSAMPQQAQPAPEDGLQHPPAQRPLKAAVEEQDCRYAGYVTSSAYVCCSASAGVVNCYPELQRLHILQLG